MFWVGVSYIIGGGFDYHAGGLTYHGGEFSYPDPIIKEPNRGNANYVK